MKSVLAEQREIAVGNVGEVSEFSIKANGKAFKVLIDGLYSDKALAVVRELCSNAFDSHAAAGQTKPFDLHLPTNFEPYFSVRDYGTSLSHAGVMKLYTTVFESSKEDSNTQVGKLGLGSKSPFAYTDTFTVTAWLDGKKRSYSAFIGQNYIPQIAFMGEEDTTEEQGFEVSFPVKSGDVLTFLNAAETFCGGLDVLPNMTGNRNERIKSLSERKAIMSGNGWWLFNDYSGAQARQGCVIYPIDYEAVGALVGEYLPILRAPVIIDFPIGEVDITASREGLSYDETTARNIYNRAKGIMDELREKFVGKIKSCATFNEAWKAYNELMADSGVPRVICDAARGRTYWRGRRITDAVSLHKIEERAAKLGDFALMRVTSTPLSRAKGFRWDATRYVDVYRSDLIVFQDLDEPLVHVEKRLQYFYQTERNAGRSVPNIIWIKSRAKSSTYRRFLALLGKPAVIEAKSLPLPPKAPGTGGPRKKVSVKQITDGGNVSDVEIDVTLGGYYFEMERNDIVYSLPNDIVGVRTQSVYWAGSVIKAARELKIIPMNAPVYVISKSIKGVLKKSTEWVSVVDLVVKETEAKLASMTTSESDIDAKHYLDGGLAYNTRRRLWVKLAQEMETFYLDSGPMKSLVDYLAQLKTQADRAKEAISLAHLLQDVSPQSPLANLISRSTYAGIDSIVDGMVSAMQSRYPMIEFMLSHDYMSVNYNHATAAAQYVNLID